MREVLAARGVRTFGDLILPGETDERFRFKLQVDRRGHQPWPHGRFAERHGPIRCKTRGRGRGPSGAHERQPAVFYRPVVQYYPTPAVGFRAISWTAGS